MDCRKYKYFVYQIPDKATWERTTLATFVATDVHLNTKQTFIVQLLYGTKWKLDLAPFYLLKGSCATWHLRMKV